MPGKRGPKPKPTALRKLHGSRVKKSQGEPQPSIIIGEIPPPRWLSTQAKTVWKDLCPKLQSYGVLTDIDRNMLAKYCQSMAYYMQDCEFLNTKKTSTYAILDDKGNIKYMAQYPQVASARNNAKLIMQLGAELGLSPSSRTRISLPYKVPDADAKPKKKSFFDKA